MHKYTDESPQSIQEFMQAKLRDILKSNAITVSESNGNLTVNIPNHETYLFDVNNDTIVPKPKITLSATNISYDNFIDLGNGYYATDLFATVDEEYSTSDIIWEMNTPDTLNLFFDVSARKLCEN